MINDRERETDWELTTFQFEGKVCVVLCQQERDARDEFDLAMVVASNDVVKFTVDPEDWGGPPSPQLTLSSIWAPREMNASAKLC